MKTTILTAYGVLAVALMSCEIDDIHIEDFLNNINHDTLDTGVDSDVDADADADARMRMRTQIRTVTPTIRPCAATVS